MWSTSTMRQIRDCEEERGYHAERMMEDIYLLSFVEDGDVNLVAIFCNFVMIICIEM